MALAYTKSTTSAQDVVQEVFLKIWEKRDELPAIHQAKNYLFITARNLIISSLRKKSITALNVEDRPSDIILSDDYFLADSAIVAKQSEAAIQRGFSYLTPKQKEVFILSRDKGFSHEEIAQQLGINRYTVKNHIVAALNTLRQYLSKEESFLLAPLFIIYGIAF